MREERSWGEKERYGEINKGKSEGPRGLDRVRIQTNFGKKRSYPYSYVFKCLVYQIQSKRNSCSSTRFQYAILQQQHNLF